MFIALLMALFALSPTLEAKERSWPKEIPSAQDIQVMEQKIIQLINQERAKEGLKPLTAWKELATCARGHSKNIANGKVALGHDGFDDRYAEMKKHARLAKFAENVAYSYNVKEPLQRAVTGWMNSPGHKKNILGDYVETGVGIAYSADGSFYVTQLFVRRM